jgi:hypothetical protein
MVAFCLVASNCPLSGATNYDRISQVSRIVARAIVDTSTVHSRHTIISIDFIENRLGDLDNL